MGRPTNTILMQSVDGKRTVELSGLGEAEKVTGLSKTTIVGILSPLHGNLNPDRKVYHAGTDWFLDSLYSEKDAERDMKKRRGKSK